MCFPVQMRSYSKSMKTNFERNILILIYQSSSKGQARGHGPSLTPDLKVRETPAFRGSMHKCAQPFLSLFCQFQCLGTYSVAVKKLGPRVTLNLTSGSITYYTYQLTLMSFTIFICKIKTIISSLLDYMK